MKKILLLIITAFFYASSCAQYLNSGVKEQVTYIEPCIENFTYLSTLSQSEFAHIMSQYHYSEEAGNAKWLSYSASLDNFLVHAVINFDYAYGGGSIISWLPIGEIYPTNAVSEIYNKLRPHYLRDEDGAEIFAFNYKGKAFGVMISVDETFYIIRTIYFGTADNRLSEL